ncbi:hypothetical protein jhhlp_005579, partial [Lomentospora prolificans]
RRDKATMTMASHITTQASEDGPVIMERKTKGERTLQYRLTVLQQPERARACGSGSKSAADRRHVDPPPVVELRIFELGPNANDSKDITFHYNANFFLFATLELARPMAHGRVQTPAATATPVLTGMPVSGMAYLDRPAEAGYFLFPDLSVRHEGRYKLSFNLYEETKEEKYFDEESSESKHSPVGASFDWRMEVKSQAFNVYSAKKFPGLTESTALSRTVADQGCRVRIRRDVRMRRRDGKPSGGDFKKEDDYSHRPSARTPERQQPHDYRQRSSSAASDHSRAPYPSESQRRPSATESYPTGPSAPPPPGYSQGGQHLGFGNTTPRLPQQYPGAQAPPASPTTAYPSSHSSPYQGPQNPHNYGSRPSSQSFGSATGAYDDRRASNGFVPPSPQYAEKREDGRVMSHGYPVAPIRTEQETKASHTLPSISHLLNHTGQEGPAPEARKSSVPAYNPPPRAEPDIIAVDLNPNEEPELSIPTGSKRRYQDSSYEEPLRNGKRPADADAHVSRRSNRVEYPDLLNMKRASGIVQQLRDGPYYYA